jgi:hypothetical protein
MSEEETIHVEEEITNDENDEKEPAFTTEEFKVAGEELVDTVKKLVNEAGVRRIVIMNRQKRVLLEIPLVLGVAGIVLLPTFSALALIAALVTDCTILVEKVVKETKEPSSEETEDKA